MDWKATHLISSDNPKRMSRVQQLVDSISNIQNDVKDVGAKLDRKGAELRPAINNLLRAHGMQSVDEAIEKAASKMTSDERKVFEAVSFGSSGELQCIRLTRPGSSFAA